MHRSLIHSYTYFTIFQQVLAQGGEINAINVKNAADRFSRKQLDQLQEYVKIYGRCV